MAQTLPETHPDRHGSSFSAGCPENQPCRLHLDSFRGNFVTDLTHISINSHYFDATWLTWSSQQFTPNECPRASGIPSIAQSILFGSYVFSLARGGRNPDAWPWGASWGPPEPPGARAKCARNLYFLQGRLSDRVPGPRGAHLRVTAAHGLCTGRGRAGAAKFLLAVQREGAIQRHSSMLCGPLHLSGYKALGRVISRDIRVSVGITYT